MTKVTLNSEFSKFPLFHFIPSLSVFIVSFQRKFKKRSIMHFLIFTYESQNQKFRTVENDGEIWFVGADVANLLGYKRPDDAIQQHCKEKGIVKRRIASRQDSEKLTLINESNVYRLIVKSQLPTAEKFEEWIYEKVLPAIRKKGYRGNVEHMQLPNFIKRYKDNLYRTEKGYFSVITQMFTVLFMELEKVGYVIPDIGVNGKQIMPDISIGITFAKYLQNVNSKYYEKHKKYSHVFPGGRIVEANQYPVEALPDFIHFITDVWIPDNAVDYFKKRDSKALSYLPKLLSK